MKRLLAGISFFLVAIVGLAAQEATWGVEFNVVWPFVPGVEIYTAKVTTELWQQNDLVGELTLGVLVRPGTTDDENAELFREFGLNLGYRQYFWRGAHVELALYPSWAIQEGNLVDGEDYSGFALTTELYGGYRFDVLNTDSVAFYVAPQAGIGFTPISMLGPSTGPEAPFPTLNLQLGGRF